MYNNNILRLWKWNPFQYSICLKKCSSLSPKPFPVLLDTLRSDISLTNAKEKSQEILQYHHKIKELSYQGGGEKGAALHVKKNKVLPRDKIKALFDDGSDTLELCLQAGLGLEYGDVPGASTISIMGKIHGQYCLVSANDGTLKGGTFYPITVKKNMRAQEVSHMNHLPKLYLVDSGGAFLPLQAEIFPDKMHGGRGFYNQAVDSAKGIPQLALVCGSCTAGGAYVPMMCDDVGIVDKAGSIFLGGPPLVKAATGETITVEALGGATLHCNVSGCTDYFARTEHDGFQMLRDAMATLDIAPPPMPSKINNDPLYDQTELDVACGLDGLDRSRMLGVISRLVDGSRFREFKSTYGTNLVVGYSFIDQMRVGVVANCGPLTYEEGLKGAHFVQICDQRNIPLLFLQNSGKCDEYWTSTQTLSPDEASNALRGRASMMTAVSCARVPKITINISSCHGDDNYTMCGPSFHPNFIFCWPGSETTLHSPVKKSPETPEPTSDKDKKKPKRPLSAFDFPSQSSWYMASRALNDGIISPCDTRKVIIQCLRIFEQKKRITCQENNFPVFRF